MSELSYSNIYPKHVRQLRQLSRAPLLSILEHEGSLTIYELYDKIEALFPANCDPSVPCRHMGTETPWNTEWHHQVCWALRDLCQNELVFNSAVLRSWIRIGDDWLRLLDGSEVEIKHGAKFKTTRPYRLKDNPDTRSGGSWLAAESTLTVTDRNPVWDKNQYVRWFFVRVCPSGQSSGMLGWVRKADLRAQSALWLGYG